MTFYSHNVLIWTFLIFGGCLSIEQQLCKGFFPVFYFIMELRIFFFEETLCPLLKSVKSYITIVERNKVPVPVQINEIEQFSVTLDNYLWHMTHCLDILMPRIFFAQKRYPTVPYVISLGGQILKKTNFMFMIIQD